MKLAFICDLPDQHFLFWDDGLKAALKYLETEYGWNIEFVNVHERFFAPKEDFNSYDFGLYWGSLGSSLMDFKRFKKQGLCFGGGGTFHPNLSNFDVIFTESDVDYKDMKRYGVNVVHAFGTNTKLFRPIPEQPKIYGYVYPAAFAKWKHHEKFAKYVINDFTKSYIDKTKVEGGIQIINNPCPSLSFGYMQPDGWEKECYEVCQQSGIAVMPQVPYEVMPYILNAAENVYVGADINGGCQRTILEAKACNIPVIVDSDSPKLLELKDLTHEEVLKNWSEEAYAKQLKKGIEGILNGK